MTIWLIAGIALSGIVCMCLITALVVVFSQV
jgi:hypothetical protein